MSKINYKDVIEKLPKSGELIHKDAAARAFFELLARGADPYFVIDEMIVHYTKITGSQNRLIMEYISKFGPIEVTS